MVLSLSIMKKKIEAKHERENKKKMENIREMNMNEFKELNGKRLYSA